MSFMTRGSATLRAIDLFAGAGGATQGLRQAGFSVVAAIESDRDAASTYRANHPDTLLREAKIEDVKPRQLRQRLALEASELTLITACPPCQGFSTLGTGNRADPRNDLVSQATRFAKEFRPAVVLVENVPGLASDARYTKMTRDLERLGYLSQTYIANAADFGVPQHRRRLICVAVQADSAATLPTRLTELVPDSFDASPVDAVAALKQAGPVKTTTDILHRPRRHSRAVVDRIKAIPENGGRLDLPPKHQLKCHKKLDRNGASTVYGRIRTTGPAPTMTTRCTTPSCGRFVHPTEHRGLTLREAALLQTFPKDYAFTGSHQAIECQIGNAIPVRLAAALGETVKTLLARTEVGAS